MAVYRFSSDPDGTHMLLLERIASHSAVLDIGSSTGYLDEYLINNKQCQVWGVEPDRESYEQAKKLSYSGLLNASVEEALASPELVGKFFDYIIMGDVFEHLVHPEAVAEELRIFLKPTGRLIVSLPNVAHYSIRRSLLFGKWNMTDAGILDRTHLHFYTLKTAQEFFMRHGYEIESMRPRGDIERWLRKLGMPKLGKAIINTWPTWWAIQFIFVLKGLPESPFNGGP